jgi:hypothetical protein
MCEEIGQLHELSSSFLEGDEGYSKRRLIKK